MNFSPKLHLVSLYKWEGEDEGNKSLSKQQFRVKKKDLWVFINSMKNGQIYRAIAMFLNVPVCRAGSIILRWKVHRTTASHPQTGEAGKNSQHAHTLMIKELREKLTVTRKELQDVLKAAGKIVTQTTTISERHHGHLCPCTRCPSKSSSTNRSRFKWSVQRKEDHYLAVIHQMSRRGKYQEWLCSSPLLYIKCFDSTDTDDLITQFNL